MDSILTDFSTPALARAVKRNFNDLFLFLKGSSAVQFYTEPGLSRWHTGIPFSWYNGVLAARPPEGDEAPTIQRALDYFQSQGINQFTWWLDPDQSLEAWGRCLEPFRFRLEKGPPGMAIDLQDLPKEFASPPGLRIVPVNDLDTLKDFIHALILGFEMPDEWESNFYGVFAEDLNAEHLFQHYLGYIGDLPAVVTSLFLDAGVAGIYNAATLPEARSRGLGTALTIAPLKEAINRGYRVGILQSSSMGYPVYERLGFKKVCDVEHFLWRAKGS